MIKNIIKHILVVGFITTGYVQAQNADSVITTAGTMDVYYDFQTGKQTSVDRTKWDIGLSTARMSASILINENAGVELFVYSNDTNDWNTVDTSGFTFTNTFNSEESWDNGAFSNLGTNHPDYGWGTYDAEHNVNGSRLFIIKTQTGDYLKMVVDQMSTLGDFTFRTANLDGTNLTKHKHNKSEANGKNFLLTNLSNRDIAVGNPLSKDWNLLFTKYITEVRQGPTVRNMAVSGVKINAGCKVAKRKGVEVSSNDTNNLDWNTKITEIGYDWKAFDRGSFKYNMVEDLAYFVQLPNGQMWKIWFTNYVGGPEGKFVFNTQKLRSGASISRLISLNTSIYPNPARTYTNISNRESTPMLVDVIDMHGKVLFSEKLLANTTTQLSTDSYISGIYTIRFNSENGVDFKKLIIE
ncbi:MAG: T9SS type A sorting domain-containing protein [Bacteroidia bacterium]|nr:T9SS type A sorting domain-containing protein [Bacteroidia bacterium]